MYEKKNDDSDYNGKNKPIATWTSIPRRVKDKINYEEWRGPTLTLFHAGSDTTYSTQGGAAYMPPYDF